MAGAAALGAHGDDTGRGASATRRSGRATGGRAPATARARARGGGGGGGGGGGCGVGDAARGDRGARGRGAATASPASASSASSRAISPVEALDEVVAPARAVVAAPRARAPEPREP